MIEGSLSLARRARSAAALFAASTALLVAPPAAARRGGIAAEGCEGCHRGGQEPAVRLLASPANPEPGALVAITVEIDALNGAVGGFYVRLREGGGTLQAPAGSGIRALAPDQLAHSAPKSASGGVVRFTFNWTAPSTPGGVIFHAWAVSANGNDTSGGDGAAEGELLLAYGCAGQLYARDPDGDGFGSAAHGQKRDCSLPAGYAERDGDCAEYDPAVHPEAPELCNEADDDCDGKSDEQLPQAPQYPDADGDGYGAAGESIIGCSSPEGYAAQRGDCDDTEATIHPEAEETCNFADDDCDGRTDEGARADCGVGWCRRLSASCSLEFCTPGEPRAEQCNLFDDDCDDVIDEGAPCADGERCEAGHCVPGASVANDAGVMWPSGGTRAPASGASGSAMRPVAGMGGRDTGEPCAAGTAAARTSCASDEPAAHDAPGGCAAAPATRGAKALAGAFALGLGLLARRRRFASRRRQG